jgi:hypothetical protein
MRILNKTRKTVIAEETEVAESFRKKTVGLMFRGGIGEACCLLMEFENAGRHSIWMLGMRFPIDLVFLDAKKRVVCVFRDVRPVGFSPKTWRMYDAPEPVKWILELRAGRVHRTGTKAGDALSFVR